MEKWCVDYVVGSWHKTKYVYAENAEQAIKRARVKDIEDLYPIGKYMFTIKSISDEGEYYLVNHWNKWKTFWCSENDLCRDMLFDKPSDAKRSLTKLLKVMEDYRNDKFELVEIELKN